MKDELDYRDSVTFNELRDRVNDYIEDYNTNRYQWALKKMTPEEYKETIF